MIKIKIDDQLVTVKQGARIIEVADDLKIAIPRFCYHEKLSIPASCGMCLVEIVNLSQLLPACSTVVAAGMQIITNSEQVKAHQKFILELLLSNHPLDCPICERAGSCELQNNVMLFGKDRSSFQEAKRTVGELDLGPLIATNMNRCIHCSRCIRFSKEIAGAHELGFTGKGAFLKVTNIAQMSSEISANMIDLCPVGALIAKPLGSMRAWELQEQAGISSHDCLGSNISYGVDLQGVIKQAVPHKNLNINDTWLSDRDRFGFLGVNSKERLKYPLIKKDNKWYITNWDEALDLIARKLSKIVQQHGREQLGGLISPNATIEEGLFFQQLLRKLGTNNIDHRLRQLDFREDLVDPCYPFLNLEKISDLKNQQVILLIGSYINKEQPIAGMYIRAAVQNQCKVIVINPIDFDLLFLPYIKFIPKQADLLKVLLQILQAINIIDDKLLIADLSINQVKNLLKDLECKPEHLSVARILIGSQFKPITIILGTLAVSHPEYTNLMMICKLIAKAIGANFGCLPTGANSLGLYLIDCLPKITTISDQVGNDIEPVVYNAGNMLQTPLKAYILYGVEPELDCIYGAYAAKTLKKSDFVVSFTAFESNLLLKYSDVLLPISLAQETGGTYINVTGEAQRFAAIAKMPGEALSGCDVMKKLAKDLGIELPRVNLQQIISQKIADLKKHSLSQQLILNVQLNTYKHAGLMKISPVGIYAVDPVIRRVKSLQATLDAKMQVFINPLDAKSLGVINNEEIYLRIPDDMYVSGTEQDPLVQNFAIELSERVPCGCIWINQVNFKTAILGLPYHYLIPEKNKEPV